MKILIVARKKKGRFAPFVAEQAEALRRIEVDVVMFGVRGHGAVGYLCDLPRLAMAWLIRRPDAIHAHYGLCGALACMLPMARVITTYHGSDINNPRVKWLGRRALERSMCNIFVSERLMQLAGPCDNPVVQPCGVDLEAFPATPRSEARRRMGLEEGKRYVLFASSFDNAIKNPTLAQEAMRRVPEAELLELKGYSREEVALLLRAVDCLLMTSDTEGSPQVVKEAMACGTPVVSVPVGDVAHLTEGLEGCYLSPRDPDALADKLREALAFNGHTRGRERLVALRLDNESVATDLLELYSKTLTPKRKQTKNSK